MPDPTARGLLLIEFPSTLSAPMPHLRYQDHLVGDPPVYEC